MFTIFTYAVAVIKILAGDLGHFQLEGNSHFTLAIGILRETVAGDEEVGRCLAYRTFCLRCGGTEFFQTRYAHDIITLWQNTKFAIIFHDSQFTHRADQIFAFFNFQFETASLGVLFVLLYIIREKARLLAQLAHSTMDKLAGIAIPTRAFDVKHAQLLLAR